MGIRTPSFAVECLLAIAVLGVCPVSQSLFAIGDPPVFREVARATGLDFHHFIGATGEYFFPEIMGSGVGVFDYDGDGDLDLYFVQGAMLDPSKEVSQSVFPFSGEGPPRNRLFRNELNPKGELRFTDVTREAGVGHRGYGMGMAVGDYDNDGHLDFYLTNFGPNVLYRNNGDGTFTDVTHDAGADDPRNSASCTFLDYDSDGDLDLYVANYVSFTIKGNRRCGGERRDYCAPGVYQPMPDRLFRNEGNGRFTDRSEEAGLGRSFGAGLGVVAVDLNLDRRVDVYVANDGTPNQLWINQGDGTFQDQGLVSGTAYNIDGTAEAGMGVTAADFDGDGDEDLFVTHNKKETNTLYLNGRTHPIPGGIYGRDLPFRAGQRERPLFRIRHALVRLRQRRMVGPLRGQRSRGHGRSAAGRLTLSLRAGEPALPRRRNRPVSGDRTRDCGPGSESGGGQPGSRLWRYRQRRRRGHRGCQQQRAGSASVEPGRLPEPLAGRAAGGGEECFGDGGSDQSRVVQKEQRDPVAPLAHGR